MRLFCVLVAGAFRSFVTGGVRITGRDAHSAMHEQFANRFYSSGAWKRCRAEFAKSRGRMCERCYAKGLIVVGSKQQPLEVHHKIPLTPENINDPSVTLNWDNLELLCKDCHEQERQRMDGRRWKVDECGRIIPR